MNAVIWFIFAIRISNICRFCVLIGIVSTSGHVQADARTAIQNLLLNAPRSYGYVIGDLVKHTITIDVQRDYKLLRDFLPTPGPINEWLELSHIAVNEKIGGSVNYCQIAITYQLFKGIKESGIEVIPGVGLRFSNGKQEMPITSPDWRFSYSPLIPAGTVDAEVEIRPDLKPNPIPLDEPIRTLALLLTGVLSLLGYLAWRYGFLPFLKNQNGPFGKACRELKKLHKLPVDLGTYQAGLRIVHRAINESAGNTVFGERTDHLYRVKPSFLVLRHQLETFFMVSRDVFFSNALPDNAQSLQWLEDLCKQHRAIERNNQ